ncbi:MAG: molecular chaperone DnaJ [Polyangiales bacterium]
MPKRDYYEVLGVVRTADGVEIKRSYRQLAMQYHPDRNPDNPAAEDAFKEASEAYAVLSDSEKRARYDRLGHAAFDNGAGGFDPADFGAVSEILEGLFGDVFRGGKKRRRAGRDLTYELEINFSEAALGVEKVISLRRPIDCRDCNGSGAAAGTHAQRCQNCHGSGQVKYQRGLFAANRPCPNCQGKGTLIASPCRTCKGEGSVRSDEPLSVKIPAGVKDGAVRTVRGAGEIGPEGKGDLHITVRVRDDEFFKREGADILCTVPISYPDAVLGATIDVNTLSGPVKMKVPAGTPSGKVFRLRGKGIPVYGGYGKGDQLVTVIVDVPQKLSRRQKRLIQDLAEALEQDG